MSLPQMYAALLGFVAALPPTTQIYCGHEYTVNNLRFAASVEPDNRDVAEKAEWAKAQVEGGKHTVPSTGQRRDAVCRQCGGASAWALSLLWCR